MSLSSHDRLAAVHALFGCLAGLVLIPSAILVARFGRGTSSWIRTHSLLNTSAIVLTILTFGLGMGAVRTADEGIQFSGEGSDLHHQLGLAVFILVLLQGILGLLAHYWKPRSAVSLNKSKSPLQITHIVLGISTVGLLYWLIWDGLYTEWAGMSTSENATPESVQIIFWLFVLFPLAIYAFKLGNDSLFHLETKRL